MPRTASTPSILQRLATVERQLADLRRSGWERDELPFYPTSLHGLVYEDTTTWTTVWETILSPRTSRLDLGLVLIGDVVSSTNTGGEWQVLFDSAVVANGNVPATFTYVFPTLSLGLAAYRTAPQLKVQVQVRRTSGATTAGRYGGGGAIGGSPRYARLL